MICARSGVVCSISVCLMFCVPNLLVMWSAEGQAVLALHHHTAECTWMLCTCETLALFLNSIKSSCSMFAQGRQNPGFRHPGQDIPSGSGNALNSQDCHHAHITELDVCLQAWWAQQCPSTGSGQFVCEQGRYTVCWQGKSWTISVKRDGMNLYSCLNNDAVSVFGMLRSAYCACIWTVAYCHCQLMEQLRLGTLCPLCTVQDTYVM